MSTTVVTGIATAVDNMRPGHRFIRALSSLPIADGVIAHSIIAVVGEGSPVRLDDGVVTYESAHIDGVASEKIVRSSHSTPGPSGDDPRDRAHPARAGRPAVSGQPDRRYEL